MSYSLLFRWTPQRRQLDYVRFVGASDRTAKEVQLFGLAPWLINRTVRKGVLLSEAQNMNAVALYPWLLTPVIMVVLTVLAFNFLGDGLRDAADPYA